jgi:hypothetical protein
MHRYARIVLVGGITLLVAGCPKGKTDFRRRDVGSGQIVGPPGVI